MQRSIQAFVMAAALATSGLSFSVLQAEERQQEQSTIRGKVISTQVRDADNQSAQVSPELGKSKVTEQGSATIRDEKIVTQRVIRENQIPTARICTERADINRMDQGDFQALGFSQSAARSIIQHRNNVGEFR